MFPPTEPFDCGLLDVGGGHHVYWERCGTRGARPALYLHGGPGSGAGAGARRYFDPESSDVVLLDQRGCGRSRPSLGDPTVGLDGHTTRDLVADLERLRELHGFAAWTVLGVSWGSTLALSYAQAHRERVDGMVLAAVTTTTAREVAWLTEDVGRFFPQEWERFAGAVPERLRGRRLVDAYAEMLADPDPGVREHAAREWCRWEDAIVSLDPGHRQQDRFRDPDFRYLFARTVTHYFRHAAFQPDGRLLRDAPGLDGIPGVLIHGRLDVGGPLDTAWRLHRRWATSRLQVLDDTGHGGTTSFTDAVVDGLAEVTAG
ncbi:proline iminopeptidase [Pseudonocardia sp. HH130630-07]|nr:proline iminopeptidase [Pseudonocardia sp. HH130630-07]